MRVLFVDHRSELSGAEKSLLELLAALAHSRSGIEPILACPPGALTEAARRAGIPVEVLVLGRRLTTFGRSRLARSPLSAVGVAREAWEARASLRGLARRTGTKACVTNSQKAHVLAALAGLEIPLVWYFRDILPGRWLPAAMRALARRRRCLAFNSAATRDALFPRGSASPRLEVIYPGIADSGTVPPAAIAALRLRLSLPSRAPIVVAPGQIARWKGQDVLLRAWPAVRASHPQAVLVFVGDVVFPENERAFGDALREQAARPDLAPSIRFAGRIDPIWPALALADVVVHAAVQPEPYGRVVVEAMRAGRPVVASNAGGPAEIVREGVTGRLIAPGDAPALARAVSELLSNRRLAARLARAGRAASLSHTPDRAASALARLLLS